MIESSLDSASPQVEATPIATEPRAGTLPLTALETRVAASAENWKRKLLDLTKRNRLLNFRSARVSTVAIVDEQPAEVFRLLVLHERTLKFKAAAESSESAAAGSGDAATSDSSTPASLLEDDAEES